MKQKKFEINQDLRDEVLSIIDQLFTEFNFQTTDSKSLAIQIISAIGYDYCIKNCALGEIFLEEVIPHLKKLDENQRLIKVKELLTNGYIDIDKDRIHMRSLPYLNYDSDREKIERYYRSKLAQ